MCKDLGGFDQVPGVVSQSRSRGEPPSIPSVLREPAPRRSGAARTVSCRNRWPRESVWPAREDVGRQLPAGVRDSPDDVVERLENTTSASLTSLTYPDGSTKVATPSDCGADDGFQHADPEVFPGEKEELVEQREHHREPKDGLGVGDGLQTASRPRRRLASRATRRKDRRRSRRSPKLMTAPAAVADDAPDTFTRVSSTVDVPPRTTKRQRRPVLVGGNGDGCASQQCQSGSERSLIARRLVVLTTRDLSSWRWRELAPKSDRTASPEGLFRL